ncbi:TetR/AcrR family transcriptional regulator [Caenimonas aquaedulcis]|uniref:TetR/AcrR family transcriptional regulator n=1 Tax=Caenimonas aquaedulcis TaxID=2793270 RepID=A0A931H4T8_9BURK|nr:TetR/AcrR family transcriptional regulator [Caenimonas aquaedulcis]MBG9388478.1 TetR/AcrR family transcriptional regulator [Caenimonas aquaedulcis]
MDTPATKKELTHRRIVETAARAIRRGGFHGVGVADIMKEAGLTHGGFYAHFASRDALLAEALAQAGRESGERIAKGAAARQSGGASAFRAMVDGYLSESHAGETERGCPVAALLGEMPRQAPEVRAAASERVHGLIATVRKALPAGTPASHAPLIASQLVGALQMARALGDGAEGKALLSQTRRHLLAQYDAPSRS